MNDQKIAKKQVAELQAIVDGLKAEEDALKARLNEAEKNLYEARREIKRNEKPTPAMLAALGLAARDGKAIWRNRWSYKYYTHDAEGMTVNVRESVFFGLIEREALSRNEQAKDEWRINDHGRAILTRWTKKDAAQE